MALQGAGKISFDCPSCGVRISAPASVAGKRVKCPKCGGGISVPRRGGAGMLTLEAEAPCGEAPSEKPQARAPEPAPPLDRRLSRRCALCGKVIRLKGEYAGKPVKCPGCQATVPPEPGETLERMEYSEPVGRLGTALGWAISAAAHLMLLLIFAAVTWATQSQASRSGGEVAVVVEEVRPIERTKVKPIDIEVPETKLPAIEVTTPAPGNLSPIPRLGTAQDATKNEPLIGIDVGIGSGAAASAGHWAGLETGKGGVGLGAADFFGIKARGKKFVYVVDKSGSMASRGKLDVAKLELLRSLRALRQSMEFYVIFYNTSSFPMPGERLVKATPENRRELFKWVEKAIWPGGDTDPTKAMRLALSLGPDAIWLLSDGIFNAAAANAIREANAGARVQIHAIAFFDNEGEAVLRKIAQENRGHYRFVRPAGK